MPWSLRLSALSVDELSRQLRFLSATILAHGGWVLSRGVSDEEIEISFEFERSGCMDFYVALIAAGLELSEDSHRSLTQLCQCTRNLKNPVFGETVGVRLEVSAQAKQRPAAMGLEELGRG